MEQFIENNWLALMSIAIGILVACVCHQLQRKGGMLAAQERKKHAINELLDVVEGYIINKQPLSQQVIENLALASERDHAVSLGATCNATALLQDVALRLQRSRHLDIPQKTEYALKIEELIRKSKEHRDSTRPGQLGTEFNQELAEFERLVPEDKKGEVRKRLTKLMAAVDGQRELSFKQARSTHPLLSTTAALAGIIAALATGVIGSGFYEKIVSPMLNNLPQTLPVVGVGAAVLLPVLFLVTTTVVRFRRRPLGKMGVVNQQQLG